jgi:co-chaperonin GroES (HSP10)
VVSAFDGGDSQLIEKETPLLIKPILDRVLLRKLEEPEVVNGVVIPDKFKESNKYEVVAVGHFFVLGGERYDVSEIVSVGDVVLVDQYSVERIEDDGEELWLARVQSIRGKNVETWTGTQASVPRRVRAADN